MNILQGQALIVGLSGPEPRVSFTGALVAPWQKTELIDVTLKTLHLTVAAHCQDGQGVLLKVAFFIKVNRASADVLQVAREVGAAKTFQPDIAGVLFGARFENAVLKATEGFTYEGLRTKREVFRDTILEIIGCALQGYHLEDIAIQRVLPKDRQTVLLGPQELTVDWLEMEQGVRLSTLLAKHAFSALARQRTDGTLDYSPTADTVLGVGDRLAVAIKSEDYDALKTALAAAEL